MGVPQSKPDANPPGWAEDLLDRDLRVPTAPSRRQLWVLTLLFTLAVFVVTVVLDRFLQSYTVNWHFTLELSDLLGALFAGALFYRLLQYERERREWLRQRIEVIAEMNHYVRNGLQAISLSTEAPGEQRQVAAVHEGMNRIQYALKEILPKLQ